jgi:hypothetical protein
MASIYRETFIETGADDIWAAVRDVGAVHERLAPGNGQVARELIVDVDDKARRLAWAVVGTALTHHNASLQVFPDGERRSRVVWIADLLPNELASHIAGMIEQGMAVKKKTLERR